jgi:peptidoglycan/LPS O-acetylase OafA/YrhL
MYLVLPYLYYLALKKRSVIYLCVLLAFFCGFGFLIAGESGGHLNMAAYVPCFLCGVLCYSLRDRILAFIPSVFWPLFLLFIFFGYGLTNPHDNPKFWIGWIFCLLLGLAINAFRDSANVPLNVVAEKIALYSYGMYLIHVPILYLVFMVFGVKNLFFGPLLFVVFTMVASFITYHLIESPLIDVGRKLSFRSIRTSACLPLQKTQEGS